MERKGSPMNNDLLVELQEIVRKRKQEREEGSYTAYLFEKGLDKVLKKLGEETSETIIAAKNLEAAGRGCPYAGASDAKSDLLAEAGDLLFHFTVMLDILGVDVCEVEELLRDRMKRKGNLKDSLRGANDSHS